MTGIDRGKVKGSFHRQATAYDEHAVVQKRVVAHLLEEIQRNAVAPRRILDVGSGTGKLLAGLHLIYPQAHLFGADLALGMCLTARGRLERSGSSVVTADAESLPFANGSLDLVISTSTYQWLTTLTQAFAEARRLLAPGGAFIFALFGDRTLFELKDAYRIALNKEGQGEDSTHGFFTAAYVEESLTAAGFDSCRVEARLEVEQHGDVPALLRSLKRIGAGNAAPKPAKGLSGRRLMLSMMDIYRQKYGNADGIPATYEVIYGIGRTPGAEVGR